jgi:hypothetical protein
VKKKIALIYTWPGSKVSGESEVIFRLVIAAKNISIDVDILSKDGFVLDSNLCKTDRKGKDHEYLFQIVLHFDDTIEIDAFSYYTLWNPPEIMLRLPNYSSSIAKNITLVHDYLSYDNRKLKAHLETGFIGRTQCDLKDCSILAPSFPKTLVKTPKLVENPNIFYCGINWERFFIDENIRHENLFRTLDTLPYMRFYGSKEAWKNYKRYISNISFDGVSILDEINKCGICLALSSEAHWQAGWASNRVYEGAAAGAVIISDTNKFIMEHFGDSVLYINFDIKNPKHMFEQIKNHFEWIKTNPEKALNMARKAQKILIEKFSLEEQLENIISNHPKRLVKVKERLYSKEPEKETLVVAFIDRVEFGREQENWLKDILQDINRQEDKSVIFALACEEKLVTKIKALLVNDSCVRIFSFKIFDDCKNKILTRCEMLFDVASKVKHDYLMIFTGNETIFSEHITTLKRALEDNKDMIAAHSFMSYEAGDGTRNIALEQNLSIYEIYYHSLHSCSGIFLMRAEIENYVPRLLYGLIDGCELLIILNLAVIMYNQKITCSRRMTVIRKDKGRFLTPIYFTKPLKCQLELVRSIVIFYQPYILHVEPLSERNIVLENYSPRLIRRYLNKRILIERVKILLSFNRKKRIKRIGRIKKYKEDLRRIV